MPLQGLQPVTPGELDEMVDELRNRATLLARLARRMEGSKTESIQVMNKLMAKRGIESLRKFYLKCLEKVGEA